MNPLMNPVGSNAEGTLNCINAVVITHVGASSVSLAPIFVYRKPRDSRVVQKRLTDEQKSSNMLQ